MYVKVTNGSVDQYPYTIGQLRRDNPNTSFPKTLLNSTLGSYGVFTVKQAVTPDYDPKTQYVETSNTPQLVDGVWTVAKTVVGKSAEQITADTENQAATMRSKRDELLRETDWTGLSDVTMSAEMATYRQALRDITSHANFPYLEDADWPTKP